MTLLCKAVRNGCMKREHRISRLYASSTTAADSRDVSFTPTTSLTCVTCYATGTFWSC
jgi:hypothetical protein